MAMNGAKKLVVFHQGRVASTAIMDILKQDAEILVLGEIFSGSVVKRLFTQTVAKLFGINTYLSILIFVKKRRKHKKLIVCEIKFHHLRRSYRDLLLELDKTLSEFWFLHLTRNNSNRVKSEIKAQAFGQYQNHGDLTGGEINSAVMNLDKISMNGACLSRDDHVRLLDLEDSATSLLLKYVAPERLLSLHYEDHYQESLELVIDSVNQFLEINIKDSDSRIRKMPEIVL